MTSVSIPRGRSNPAITKTQSDSHSAWHSKLDASIACLRLLLSPSQANSKAWKPVNQSQNGTTTTTTSTTNNSIGNIDSVLTSVPSTSQNRLDSSLTIPTTQSVKVHRRSAGRTRRDSNAASTNNGKNAPLLPPGSSQGADIYRAVCHVPLPKQLANSDYEWEDLQDAFQRMLTTPECRPLWDHMVDDSEVIEELDAATRISRTIFRLGWPASHRDAITISRTIKEGHTLMDVSTSLPRSPDAPAYLRPAPPYVRSHVNLFAWFLTRTPESTMKITLFWSWDLKGAWLGMPAGGLGAQLPNMITSLVSHVEADAARVPYLTTFGRNVEITGRRFDPTRDMITVDYQVICEHRLQGDELSEDEETLVWSLPAAEGWNVHVDVRPLIASLTNRVSSAWQVKAFREFKRDVWKSANVTVRMEHGKDGMKSELESGVRGKVTIQRIAASHEVRLRLNDSPCDIEDVEAPDKIVNEEDQQNPMEKSSSTIVLLDDAASISGISLQSEPSSTSTAPTLNGEDIIKRVGTPLNVSERIYASPIFSSPISSNNGKPVSIDRTHALAGLIRRNYIYFTSLLQEPEAKWKHYSDSKGVTITQLDSIDPTLVVYRAEATFVNVGVWDIFATIGNAGVKSTWDKGAEETKLIEDLGDASKLWWTKTKAAWPISSRDNVTIETSYKSPLSIHVFSFSTDDRGLFPSLPKADVGTIRTQVDLRGWSIESLSPTTVHITLIEQSDPKGWTSKSQATPAAMTASVAGVGDFAIKQGGPPITTRLLGAKTKLMKYEHDKGTMRLEYELAATSIPSPPLTGGGEEEENNAEVGHVECEIRCDMETWCSGLDLVVDPPPINVSCLRRHKLSQGGSGLWLTIEHVAASLEDDLARVTVRKASASKEKGIVHVNGARIKVDVDEMGEEEVAQLKERKRTKPKRVPLDLINSSPRLLSSSSTIKRNVGIATGSSEAAAAAAATTTTTIANGRTTPISRAGTPALPTSSHDALSNAVVSEVNDVFSDERPRQPMTCALDVLFLLRRIHAERSPDPAGNPAGWSLVSQRNGLFVRRRMMQSISNTIHVQRGDKVVEGLTAEDILSAISSMSCRKLWDEKVDQSMLLESYGNGANTGFFTTKASFPFRGRGFHLASLTARSGPSLMNLGSAATPTVFFHASASFPERNSTFSLTKLNPTGLPLGKVLIDGWILETLDPYSSTLNYQIPSTRCTHVVAVDYAGSLPIAVNTMWNSNLPRSILAVEEYVKSKGTLPCIRSPPCCVEVLGDGRDEDRNLIWNMEDDQSKRVCTMLSNTFHPISKLYTVLVKMDSKKARESHANTPSSQLAAVPFPRKVAPSNASTTKGGAAASAAAVLAPAFATSFEGGVGTNTDGLFDKVGNADDQETMSRATSVSSIRSITKNRPSLTRIVAKKSVDLVVLDIEVELRHYERGYEVVISSELGGVGKEDGEMNGQDSSLSLSGAPEVAQILPLGISSFDLPPSAVLAATLDPSARPRKHLLRVTLPTATIFQGSNEDPLNGPEPDEAPKWFHDLCERGACIRLIIRPLGKDSSIEALEQREEEQGSSPSIPSSEIDSQQVPVVFQGKKIQVTHVNQTSAMLQRESEKEEGYARLKRVAPSLALKAEAEEKKSENVLDDRLPALLQYPIASAKELRKDKEEDERGVKRDSITGFGVVDGKETGHLSTATSTTEMGESATPKAKTAVELTSTNQPPSIGPPTTTGTSIPIMGILNAYPLSRLGASTAISTAVANGGVFAKTNASRAKERLQGGINPLSHEREGSKDKNLGNIIDTVEGSGGGGTKVEDDDMPGNLVLATTENIRKRLSDIRFTLSTLILVAIIAFLFGSLVRSLLEPADFIFVDSFKSVASSASARNKAGTIQEAARDEIKRMLDQKSGKQTSLSSSSSSSFTNTAMSPSTTVVKRELKRLVEFRGLIGGWDLVIAAARW